MSRGSQQRRWAVARQRVGTNRRWSDAIRRPSQDAVWTVTELMERWTGALCTTRYGRGGRRRHIVNAKLVLGDLSCGVVQAATLFVVHFYVVQRNVI